MDMDAKMTGIMPTFRDIYPGMGSVGNKYIIKILESLPQRDCLFILSKLSQHYYKYVQRTADKGEEIYRKLCYELLDEKTIRDLEAREAAHGPRYKIIFPELSVLHVTKLVLQNCDATDWTREETFPNGTLYAIGKCLLVANAVLSDWQIKGVLEETRLEDFAVNFTKQIIVDHNFDETQKLYQSYFLFQEMLRVAPAILDLNAIFLKKFGVNVDEYFAFAFVIFSHFMLRNTKEEDYQLKHLDHTALDNLLPKFKGNLLEDLIINNINYKKIDLSFFNAIDIIRRPLVRHGDGKITILSLKRLLLRISDSIYFDILDHLETDEEKKLYSTAFGEAVENYFRDIIQNIDPKQISPFVYGKPAKQTPDSISIHSDEVGLFLECKKKQFHTLEFLQKGTWDMFLGRIKDFYFTPLQQLCNRIADFRSGEFQIDGLKSTAQIHPIVVCPITPPIFSGAWDKLDLNQYVLPDDYETDAKISAPEFMDFAELECIEACLRHKPELTFVDLIELKRDDANWHNANWMTILIKNGLSMINTRQIGKYHEASERFAELVFGDKAKKVETA